jgi:hypothetical protein
VLLDLSIILTLLVLWVSFTNEVRKQAEEDHLRALVGSYQEAWASPQEKAPEQCLSLEAAEKISFSQDPPHYRTKLLIELKSS